MKITKAVIPCGGLGTRFLPITKAVAKEMLPVIDRPSIDYIVEEMADSGITDILIIVAPGKDVLKNYFMPNEILNQRLLSSGKKGAVEALAKLESRVKISYEMQTEAKGSGHALLYAEKFCNGEPFALAFGDDVMYSKIPVIKQLMEAYDKHKYTILGVQSRELPDILKYGVVDLEKNCGGGTCKIRGIMEKPKQEQLTSKLAALGRYIVSSDVFDYIRLTPIASNNELQITDTFNIMAAKSKVFAHEFEGRRYDLGDKLGMMEAWVEYGLRSPEFGSQFAEYLKKLVK